MDAEVMAFLSPPEPGRFTSLNNDICGEILEWLRIGWDTRGLVLLNSVWRHRVRADDRWEDFYRCRARAQMESVTDQNKAHFYKAFDLFDITNCETIGLSELRALSCYFGGETPAHRVEESIRAIGGGGDIPGQITDQFPFSYFFRWLSYTQTSGLDQFAVLKAKLRASGCQPLCNNKVQSLQEVFAYFDVDGSGSLDTADLAGVFGAIGEDIYVTDEELADLMGEESEIEFEEFVLLLCSNFGGGWTERMMRESFEEGADPDLTGLVTPERLFDLMMEKAGGIIPEEECWMIIESIPDQARTEDGQIIWAMWEDLWQACEEED